jgi:hypothetical protein
MLNSLHLKRSEDCNLNLITVGKLNTEVNSYVPFVEKLKIKITNLLRYLWKYVDKTL